MDEVVIVEDLSLPTWLLTAEPSSEEDPPRALICVVGEHLPTRVRRMDGFARLPIVST